MSFLSHRISLATALAVAVSPLAIGCQGQMREQVSYRSMEKPLDVPADHVAMDDESVDLEYPIGETGGPANPERRSPAILDLGKQKYEAQCAPCHGITGAGDGKVGEIWMPPPTPLDNERFKAMSDGQLYLRIVKGGAAGGALMPSYAKKLTERERWAVVHYLKAELVK